MRVQGRLAHEDGAASSALRSTRQTMSVMPVAVVIARDVGAGQGRSRESHQSSTRSCRRSPIRPRPPQRRAANSRGCTEQHDLQLAYRRCRCDGRLRSSLPSTSPPWSSSTTGWCRTRWSRARRLPITIPAAKASRCGTRPQNPHVARLVYLGVHRHGARAQAARHCAGRGRRLRLEDFHLS